MGDPPFCLPHRSGGGSGGVLWFSSRIFFFLGGVRVIAAPLGALSGSVIYFDPVDDRSRLLVSEPLHCALVPPAFFSFFLSSFTLCRSHIGCRLVHFVVPVRVFWCFVGCLCVTPPCRRWVVARKERVGRERRRRRTPLCPQRRTRRKRKGGYFGMMRSDRLVRSSAGGGSR